MKHPLETLMSAAGILLLALLSCLLLPAPSLGLTLAQKLVATFHLMDLNQLYTPDLLPVVFSAGRHRVSAAALGLASLVFP
ncbi:putative inner membrane protein [Klebsiella michiganensis]|uniref:Putative inner membrane protein n=1 Tax=Klebsiella michiganensis TaxID=1134687 RepID=A0A7H4N593_9ENTR|nr:putative inner membrane protein [Klebsiella michiganensis]